MASYSKEIEQMRLDSYESVTSLFGLATSISTRLGLSNPNVTGDFQFQLGQITCVCDNYNEFVENAYGTLRAKLINDVLHMYKRVLKNNKNQNSSGFIQIKCYKAALNTCKLLYRVTKHNNCEN